MKILLISSYLPYPLFNGGNIRLYNLLKELQKKKHEVTLVAEIRSSQTKKDIEEVEKVCSKVITVPRKKQWSVGNILQAGLSRDSFLITGHTLPQMREVIQRELSQIDYDLIHVETFYVIQNLPETKLPVVLVEHNIEYFVYQRYTDKAPLFLRPLLSLDVAKIKRAEQASWKRATVVATVSEDEKKVINQKNCFVVANGVDTTQFKPKTVSKEFLKKDKTILYIGDYKWMQNRDGVQFIIKEIWPQIKNEWKTPDVNLKLWIVGRNMPESLKELGRGDRTIHFDDNNKQTTPEIFTEADILLAPKRVGGGTSYKTLEAMAVGTPVVTNSLGIEGLAIKKDQDIVVVDSPLELASETIRLLSNEKEYKQLSENSRKAIEKIYDWSAITSDLETIYKEVLA